MEQKTKVFKISPQRLKEDLQVIKESSYFPYFDCVLNDRATVEDMERIAKELNMKTVFIFKSLNRTVCNLSW
jgi:hypothetical protein